MKGFMVFIGIVLLSGVIGLNALYFLRNIEEDINNKQNNKK